MSRIDIQTLSKWEQNRIIVDCCVRRCVVNGNWGMGKSSNKFLHITYSLNARYWGPKGRIVPELEVKTDIIESKKSEMQVKTGTHA